MNKWEKRKIKKEFNTNKDYYLKNLTEASELILKHIDNNSKISNVTDFDTDGLGCSYVMDWLFKQLNYDNYNIYIPDRSEGYGLSMEYIKNNKDIDLIITADNGISKYKEVEYAKSLGISVIITDHHNLPPILPDCIIVNPKLESSDYMKDVCGTGVVWFLAKEVLRIKGIKANVDEILDMVACSTIADMVSLDGCNRELVIKGLKLLNDKKYSSKGLEMMFSQFGSEITSETIAFGVSAIFNSLGRLKHMNIAYEFLCKGKTDIYDEIIENNEHRKRLQQKFSSLALKEVDTSQNIIIYENNDIPKGLIGLVASDLMNKFYKPTIVMANGGGSGRSVNDIDLYDVVFNKNSDFVESGGGHTKAIGVNITNVCSFKEQLEKYANLHFTKEQLTPSLYYYDEVYPKNLEQDFIEVNKSAPFGIGNLKSNVIIRNQTIQSIRVVGKLQNVLQITFESRLKGVKFKTMSHSLKQGDVIDVLGSISKNEWNGWINYQIIIEDYKVKT